jgi:glycolate oxidase
VDIFLRLAEIVGEDFVSNKPEELFMYSRDSGAQSPRSVDYVVMPKTVEEVQGIIRLANDCETTVTPMGGGFTTSALAVPLRGGILVDMKRMDRIIEVNKRGRYAVMEAGVSQGALKGYLEKYHPRLQHCTPEAPPTVTVVGNSLILGHGHLTTRYGINSEFINGMEVVLPNGDVTRVGSCSVSPLWFTRGPLPDLAGLFIGWLGTTGIVTKISIRLFPKPDYRDAIAFVTDNLDLVPRVVSEINLVDLQENFFIWGQEKPEWMDHIYLVMIVSGGTEEELEFKKQTYRRILRQYEEIQPVGELPPALRKRLLDVPPFAAAAADFRKGGGFEYTGAIIHVDKLPEAWRKGREIASRYGMLYSHGVQVLADQSLMFAFVFSFNRADEEDTERARRAIDESDRLTLELGGMVWRPDIAAQRMMMEKMDSTTSQLIKDVRRLLDPNGIMNPGNWE